MLRTKSSKIFAALALAAAFAISACADYTSSYLTINNPNGRGEAYVDGYSEESVHMVDKDGKPVTQAMLEKAAKDAQSSNTTVDTSKWHLEKYTITRYLSVDIRYYDNSGKYLGSETYTPPENFDPNSPEGRKWLQDKVDEYFKTHLTSSNSPTPTPTPTPSPSPVVTDTVKDAVTQSILNSVTTTPAVSGYVPPI